MGEHVDWSLHRTEMAIGMGKFSEAVYGNSQLAAPRARGGPLDDRADQRLRRVPGHPRQGRRARTHIDEGFYAEVADWATTDALTEREKLAAEFAQRFALDHQAMDDDVLGAPARARSPTTRSPT